MKVFRDVEMEWRPGKQKRGTARRSAVGCLDAPMVMSVFVAAWKSKDESFLEKLSPSCPAAASSAKRLSRLGSPRACLYF